MSPTALVITATTLVEDLERLALAGTLDPVAVEMIREGLFVIADAIGALPDADGLIERVAVMRLVEPGSKA